MNADRRRIGFIGLGIMGALMARNVKKAGYDVAITNRSERKRQQFADARYKVAATPAELAKQVDVIVVIVTDPNAVRAVLQGKDGVLSAEVKGKTLIQMSTLDGVATAEFAELAAEHSLKYLDCPVTGSKLQAKQAQLILLAGGDKTVVEENEQLLKTMGKTIVHAGDIGKGTALKLCMNLIVSQMATALCESVALARVQNVAPKLIFEVIQNSPAINCGYFQMKERAMLEGDFDPAFTLSNMLKDVRFMDETAKRKHLSLPVTKAVRALMESGVEKGFGEEDLMAMVKVF
jgi:3-hydroxyisobutyrate dehydrogenase-like beta-hydroxyacid dehydrogenase